MTSVYEDLSLRTVAALAITGDSEAVDWINEQPIEALVAAAALPAAPAQGTPFNLLLVVEGLETSDERMFEKDTTNWRDPPIPFMVQDTTAHGPGQTPAPAWAAGQIEEIYRDPKDPTRIMGRGHYMANEAGRRGEELARGAFRGVSVDGYPTQPGPPTMQATAVDQDGGVLGVLTRYSGVTISRVTQVPTQALEPCRVWFDDEEMPEATAAAHGGDIATDTEPTVVHVAPDPAFSALVAAGGPVNPPREWFFTPEPDEYQPMSTTPDGHVTGHIARAGQCFLGRVNCETAPPSRSHPPYKGFHRTVAQCADGTAVACGWLTTGGKHAPQRPGFGARDAADHYDNLDTATAKIRVTNGRHGVWASGAALPGIDERAVAILQGIEVSGDWRRWQDPETGEWCPLELMGVHGVPFPAFPGTRTRPELLVASGQVVGQHGQIMPCEEGEPMTPAEQAEHDALIARVETLEGHLALVASASGVELPEPTVAAADEGLGVVDGAHDAAAEDTVTAALIESLAVPLTVLERVQWIAKYDADERSLMSEAGEAMPDGSFAIHDMDDLKVAIRAAAAENTTDGQRRHVMRCAAALEATPLVPTIWAAGTGSLPPALRKRAEMMKAKKEKAKAEAAS